MFLIPIMLGTVRTGVRVAWLPLALSLALVALVLSWILRPARRDRASDGLPSAVLASVALLLLASTLPVGSRTSAAPARAVDVRPDIGVERGQSRHVLSDPQLSMAA